MKRTSWTPYGAVARKCYGWAFPDAPDLLVRCGAFQTVSDGPSGQRWGKYVLMEVKAAKGKLKPGQHDFRVLWPETVIVRSVAEALAAIGAGT